MVQSLVNVRLHALSALGTAHGAASLDPRQPIGIALNAALPTLAKGSALAAPEVDSISMGNFPSPGDVRCEPIDPKFSSLGVVRNGQLFPLDPTKSSEEQNIGDGESLLIQRTVMTEGELIKHVGLLAIEQGNLQEAIRTLSEKLAKDHQYNLENRQFEQRDRVVWFILRLFACLLLVSIVLLVVDGFQIRGFQLTAFVRNSFMTSVVAEVAGLVMIVFRFLFPTSAIGRRASHTGEG